MSFDLNSYLASLYFLVFDSWGKPSDGLLTGHFKWPGMYDECKNITTMPPANSTYLKERLHTKYCSMYMPVIVSVKYTIFFKSCPTSDHGKITAIVSIAIHQFIHKLTYLIGEYHNLIEISL